MIEDHPRKSAVLRQIAGVTAGFCAFTTLGSLAVCFFTLPEAWPMVVLWACLTCIFAACSRWGRPTA